MLTHHSSAKLSAPPPDRSPQLIEEGSRNIYVDLGCADADVMQRKAMLVVRISEAISAKALGLDQASTVSHGLYGRL